VTLDPIVQRWLDDLRAARQRGLPEEAPAPAAIDPSERLRLMSELSELGPRDGYALRQPPICDRNRL
jgi:hypothetical protein